MVKISIVMAVYNAEKTVASAITSLNNQTYKNFELIVMDGGSTDNTVEIIKSCALNLTHIKSEADRGVYDALNKGIAFAKGDVIGVLHSDDILASVDVLSVIANAFEDDNLNCVYGDLVYTEKNNTEKIIRHWKSNAFRKGSLFWGWMPPHPTMYVKRLELMRAGEYNTNFKIASDYLMILRLFQKIDFKSRYIPTVLVKMRAGGVSNRSIKNIIAKSQEDYRIIKMTNTGNWITLAAKNLRKIKQFT